jgi:hypothetical protein
MSVLFNAVLPLKEIAIGRGTYFVLLLTCYLSKGLTTIRADVEHHGVDTQVLATSTTYNQLFKFKVLDSTDGIIVAAELYIPTSHTMEPGSRSCRNCLTRGHARYRLSDMC